jgi:hypothetical protein
VKNNSEKPHIPVPETGRRELNCTINIMTRNNNTKLFGIITFKESLSQKKAIKCKLPQRPNVPLENGKFQEKDPVEFCR